MASPSSPQHEPTMEEILASIRKIISEDSSEPQPAAPAAAAAPQAASVEAESDVLELTEEVEEVPQPAPAAAQPAQAAAPTPAPEPVQPPPPDDVVFQSDDEKPAPAAHAAAVAAPAPQQDGLVSDKARGAVDDALSRLDFGTSEARGIGSIAPIDGLSVEAVFDRAIRETFEPVLRTWLHEQANLIVDRMKPTIREWMDDNLPEMIRAAVETEVARAVRARANRR